MLRIPSLSNIASGGAGWLSGGIGGALIGTAANMFLTDRTNKQNRQIANDQMAFQERMSSTAHQREVQDLLKAGLNPTLSAHGSGASSPGGAGADMKAPQISLPDFYQVQSLMLDKDRLEIDRQNSAANIAKTLSDTELTKMKKILAQKGMIRADLEGEASSVMRKIMDYFRGMDWNKDSRILNHMDLE